MQFQVPQFIEVEDKIFGPLTFRQFAYLAGAAGFAVVVHAFVSWTITIFISAPVIALALALAFYKVNSRPFITVLEAAFYYALSKKLYLWKHEPKKLSKQADLPIGNAVSLAAPRLSQNKLKDIAWSLDIQESIYSRPNQQK
ncbi:hypothetical protein A2671_01605 [Candidatus Kaiserbacteria bacterium RIFCSPHIGHO2_01_FULL_49_13]|uniref:PrgI family protein n=1 Tax=Candidatus Kaiserbacteria bacterium RIFCSPHIGHO2_01_FULL_49_13 TaxID=1798477 RepID=A0A1F6CEQ8_9BACT|nr:MAG: hypothetical protein A2671_01605 [Candidatus Kaiserbacteria bacterium RIFCSPHIGHO2_01_FULL_49_13]